jgi:hypothetical protein
MYWYVPPITILALLIINKMGSPTAQGVTQCHLLFNKDFIIS